MNSLFSTIDDFESKKPSEMLKHQAKYSEADLDIQDESNFSLLEPVNRRNLNRYNEYKAYLMNNGQDVSDTVGQYHKMLDSIAGHRVTEAEIAENDELDQRQADSLFGVGRECPLCLEKSNSNGKRYTSEHHFQFHLRTHKPSCPNCKIRLKKWSQYRQHLPYCSHKFAERLKPSFARRKPSVNRHYDDRPWIINENLYQASPES